MNAQQLKNSILQEAIEGRLVPQDPNDEPASVLLDKIRKEKARLVREGVLKKGELKEREINITEVPFEIPKGWIWTKIDNIAFVTKLAGFEYSKYIATNLVPKDKGIPLFKGKNVQNGKIVYDFESYIPLSLSNELRRSQINKKCLLTPYVGTIGNIGIHDKEGVFHLGSNVGKIEFYNNPSTNILEEYAKYYLMSRYGYQELTKYKKATAQESISIEAIRDVFIPIPPIKEQKRIADKISSIFVKVDEYGKAQDALDNLNEELPERLKKSILQEAIEGRLIPQDSNDEPASVLLEKIRKEKEKLVNEGILKKKDLKEKPTPEYVRPFNIPQTWEWVKVFDCVNIIYGYPFDSNLFNAIGEGFPLIRIRDILPSNTSTFTTEKADERYIIRKGDMLVGMDGNFNVRFWNSAPAYLNQRVCKIKTKEYILSQKYLYYYLPIALDNIFKSVSYVTVKHLSDKHLRNILVPLPPLAEQRRIVAKLEQLFGEIEKLKV